MRNRTVTVVSAAFIAVVNLSAIGPAQYQTDFESLNASATGTVLTGQDSFYLPAVTGSLDYHVWTYAGNTPGIVPNPFGGFQFAAGVNPAGGQFRRGQRDITYGPGAWRAAFDACVVYGGTLPATDNIGSFSLQPTGASQSFIALARWVSTATAMAWKADYVYYDAVGVQITASVPNPAFQNLAVNNWYRWETVFDFTTNQILRLRITDLNTLLSTSFNPSGWYMFGGSAGSTPPTAFRLFAGGSVSGNTMAFDNLDISPAPPEYQVNSPASSLDIDGLQGIAYGPAVTLKCPGAPGLANFASTNVGLPWEAVLAAAALVPAGGGAILTPGGQFVNVNLAAPLVLFLNGGAAPVAVPFPAPSFAAGFVAPATPITLSIQQANADPTYADGFALSQGCQLNVVASGPLAGPAADDSALQVTFGVPPLCGPQALSFFGMVFTQFQVISNGRIMFGTPNTSFTPTVAVALTDSPFVGAWVDLNPATGGSITITSPTPATVRVDWLGVPYFGNTGSSNSFGIQFDTSGLVTIDGLTGFQAGTQTMFLGISAGNLGATDPGATVFSVGGPNPGPPGLGMIYELGITGTLAAGVNILIFSPNMNPNYDWAGL